MITPTVSVIMATYNHAAFVAQAIESVLSQRDVDFEFIIADDGSRDRTRDVVASFQDKRIRFFPHEVNRGACDVTNELIQRASGEFIALINSDDYWADTDKLAYQLQIMRDNPAIGACFGRARFVDKDGGGIAKSSLPFGDVFDQGNRSQGAWLRRLFDRGNCICHPTMLIRTSCYKEVGLYNNRLRQLPDLDMWIRLIKRYPIYVSERSLINFRIMPGENASTQTGTNLIRTVNEHYLIADTFFDNVSAEQLIEGFGDVLKYRDVPSREHLDIEKAMLFFSTQNELDKPYQTIGILKLYRLLNNPAHHEILSKDYRIDDRWFQLKMGDIDVLRPKARDEQIANLLHELQALQLSTSWRATAPLRWASHQVRRANHVLKTVPSAIRLSGGLRPALAKAVRFYRNEGLAGIRRGLIHVQTHGQALPVSRWGHVDQNDYQEWIKRYDTLDDAARKRICDSIQSFPRVPRISVLMPVYDPPLRMLDEAIRSVRNQLYPEWELCIADDASTNPAVRELLERHAAEDGRIRVAYHKENGHISAASNTSLQMATGEFVALLDHDDLLTEQALFCVAEAINRHPDAGLIYSDEDKINESGLRYDPYFKCDWNYDLFLSQNMISHLGAYDAGLLRRIGGFREGLEGSQDYDLVLRCIEHLDPSQIIHIPRVLYHWRTHSDSTALSVQAKPYAHIAAERALNDHLARKGIAARVERHPDIAYYRVRYALPEPSPLVTLIIPTRNGLHLIRQCLSSILERTDYSNYEILIVDNGSDDPQTLAYFDTIRSNPHLRILRDDGSFNYSALNNRAVQVARGELIGLVNNDIEVISGEWLTEMASIALQPGVGAVGARLWYPDNTLQHGGVVLGVGGVAGHSHRHIPKGHNGYFARAILQQTFSAVTAACLVVRRSIFLELGGLEEKNLKIAFGDVDFCLRVREAGYRNVWTPYAELYHHESASRGYEDTREKRARFGDEAKYMQQRWGSLLLNDPAYNPNLTLVSEDFSSAWPPRVSRRSFVPWWKRCFRRWRPSSW